jgi:hypothetical protein
MFLQQQVRDAGGVDVGHEVETGAAGGLGTVPVENAVRPRPPRTRSRAGSPDITEIRLSQIDRALGRD